jgi:hypothetical protein
MTSQAENEPLGVMFLMDGLNFNQGDGEATLEDLDVAALSHAEVFRGSDAFKYGALTLGGAVNQIYAASVDVIADARTELNPEIFHPGDGALFLRWSFLELVVNITHWRARWFPSQKIGSDSNCIATEKPIRTGIDFS